MYLMYKNYYTIKYETNKSKQKLEKLIHDIRILRQPPIKPTTIRVHSITSYIYTNTLDEYESVLPESIGLSKKLLDEIEIVSEPREKTCCICLNEYGDDNVVRLSCNHEFHKDCVFAWLEKHTSCPECRCNLNV